MKIELDLSALDAEFDRIPERARKAAAKAIESAIDEMLFGHSRYATCSVCAPKRKATGAVVVAGY